MEVGSGRPEFLPAGGSPLLCLLCLLWLLSCRAVMARGGSIVMSALIKFVCRMLRAVCGGFPELAVFGGLLGVLGVLGPGGGVGSIGVPDRSSCT